MAPPPGDAGNVLLVRLVGRTSTERLAQYVSQQALRFRKRHSRKRVKRTGCVLAKANIFRVKLVDDMVYFILLILGSILVLTSGYSLNCTNDYDSRMSCYTEAHNCTGLKMTLGKKECTFESCGSGCCCSIEMMLISGDKFLAKVYEDGQNVHSQTIDVYATIKPQTPFIKPVTEISGMYQIEWRTNTKRSLRDELLAVVTYWKKGDHTKISERVQPSTMEDRNYFEILGRNLEPNTTYVVCVKTYTTFGVFSDSSNKVEFTTAASSTNGGLIAIILCLSVVAIVVSAVGFASFIKLKGTLWDKAAKDEKPTFLDIKPKKKVILKPESPSVCTVSSVEPLIPKHRRTMSKESLSDTSGRSGQTSGISTASSSLDYANTQPVDMEECVLQALKDAFPIFTAAEDVFSSEEPMQGSVDPTPFENTSSPTLFFNKSYISDKADGDQEMICDPGYHSSDGPKLHDFMSPPQASAVMETDMSYKPCTQSGENSSGSQNLLQVIYGYHDFEKLAEQSNSSVKDTEESQSSVLDLTAEMAQAHCAVIPREITVDHGYHCV